jgi:actin
VGRIKTMSVAIVIDNGSSKIKAGFAGERAPTAVFPTVVGRPRSSSVVTMMSRREKYFIGDEAQERRGILSLMSPIKDGIITNWDDMEKIWNHTFKKELNVNVAEHPLLLTHSSTDHEKSMEILFEKFVVPALSLQNQAVLALFASSRVTGVVLQSGEDVTYALPVYQGYGLHYAEQAIALAGASVTEYLARNLAEKGFFYRSSVCDIKETLCYVKKGEEKVQSDAFFTLPDGEMIAVGDERRNCTEIMFDTSLFSTKHSSVQEITKTAVKSVVPDLHNELFENIVLAGGNSLFKGFAERMADELRALLSATMKVRVVEPPERLYSTWIGGSVVASLSTFADTCVSRKEYEESGRAIAHY